MLYTATGAGGVLSVPFAEGKLQAVRHHVKASLQDERTFAKSDEYALTR